jgi:hypothetical protein
MKIPFRQGLISFYKSGSTPLFLVPSATASFIDFNVSPDPTVVTFAHGGSNYVQIFDRDVDAAWGPISGECYIYWEIDLLTALVQYKITALAPVYGLVAPVSPVFDQHWFDLSDTTMKVWTGTKWAAKVAVFAAHVHNAALTNIDANTRGSQVGLASEAEGGYIMVDTLQRPVRAVNFEFLTTSTPVYIRTTSSTSGVLAIPPNAFVPVRASQTIPAFSLVYFTGADTVGLASSDPSLPVARTPIGIVQMPLQPNDLGVLTQSGEIQWDQWDWSAHLGAPLYCNAGGQVTTVRPNSLLVYRVGFVKNKQTVLFQIDAETMPQIFQANANDIIVSGVAPITTSFSTNLIGERVWSVSAPNATAATPGFMPSSAVTNLIVLNSDVATLQTDVASRALIGHTQAISTIIGLQDALDTKSMVGHNHDLLYLPIGYTGFDTRYAPFAHTQEISTVNGLQEAITSLMTSLQNAVDSLQLAINAKADRVHSHVITDITDLLPALDALTLAVSTKVDATYSNWPLTSVSGLVLALAGKAQVSHNHIIAEVTGLQVALDDKAAVNHNHDGVYLPVGYLGYDSRYSQLGHTHVIGEVVGLQPILDSKAAVVHTHVAADVTDFSEAVDGRVAALLQAGTNISLTYNDVANSLTIDATLTPSLPSSTILLVA